MTKQQAADWLLKQSDGHRPGDYTFDEVVQLLVEHKEKEAGMKWPKVISHDQLLRILRKVSLFDLSDCEFEYSDIGDTEFWINALSNGNGTVVDSIKWDGNIFWMMNNGGDFSPLNPMSQAFAVLISQPSPPDTGLREALEKINEKISYLDKEVNDFNIGKTSVRIGSARHLDYIRKNAMNAGLLIAKEIIDELQALNPTANGHE